MIETNVAGNAGFTIVPNKRLLERLSLAALCLEMVLNQSVRQHVFEHLASIIGRTLLANILLLEPSVSQHFRT